MALITADATQTSGVDFFRLLTGGRPLTPAQKAQHELDRQAWIAERKAECRRELERTRDRLCEQASPELQARWRQRWAAEDAAHYERMARAAA